MGWGIFVSKTPKNCFWISNFYLNIASESFLISKTPQSTPPNCYNYLRQGPFLVVHKANGQPRRFTTTLHSSREIPWLEVKIRQVYYCWLVPKKQDDQMRAENPWCKKIRSEVGSWKWGISWKTQATLCNASWQAGCWILFSWETLPDHAMMRSGTTEVIFRETWKLDESAVRASDLFKAIRIYVGGHPNQVELHDRMRWRSQDTGHHVEVEAPGIDNLRTTWIHPIYHCTMKPSRSACLMA